MAGFEIVWLIERISVGVFMLVSRWPKKRCLALSKAERAADLACRFSVPVAPVMLAAPSPRQIVMDDGEGPGIGVVDAGLLRRQRVLDQLIFHAVEGERTGG